MNSFSYTNPITRDPVMSMRDHQILKVEDRWYMTGTSAPYWKGLNPGVRLFSSTNLLDWKFEDWLINSAKLADDCFFSAWTRGYEIGVLKAPTPLGPWTLTPNSPIMGTRKRRFRQKQAEAGG